MCQQGRTDLYFVHTEADNPTDIPVNRNFYAFAARQSTDRDTEHSDATFDVADFASPNF